MNLKSILSGMALATVVTASSSVWACDMAGKSTHVGSLMTVDAEQSTFTIQDAQTHGPITFAANDEIIQGLKDASGGSIMVNYTEDGDTLKAVGVTF
jgi:hypothetical protein